jgi:hypothetical protein
MSPQHDIIAEVVLYSTEAGGPHKPIGLSRQVRCPLLFPDGAYHDGCIRFDLTGGQLGPGETARLPIDLLDPETALPKLHEGAVLYLWPGRKIGSATVLQVRSAT